MISVVHIACFLVSFVVSLILTPWVRRYAHSRRWESGPTSDRHIHKSPIPRLGGVAICGSFVLVALLAMLVPKPWGLHFSSPARGVACVCGSIAIIFALGLYDDIRGIGPYAKFAIQAVAASLLYAGGIGVQRLDLYSVGHSLRTLVALPLTIIWVLLITNAFNLLDGLDGLAAGSAFFSTIVLCVMSLFVPHFAVAMLTIVLAGVILGFLPYNFHPASIFLGDSGSMFIGFMLAALALAGSEKAPIMIAVAIPVLSFGLPILDVTLAVARRFLGGKSIFAADADHIHHKLLKRGLSQRGAVLILYLVTAVFALLSLIVLHDATLIAVVLILIGFGVAAGVQYLGYAEFSEVRRLLQRTALQKRIVANNVEVRHAIEALNTCTDANRLFHILKSTLETLGFDGFRIACGSAGAFDDATYDVQLSWEGFRTSEPSWELRFDLIAENQARLGYCALLRRGGNNSFLVDLNILICDFRAALSRTMVRITEGSTTRLKSRAGQRVVRAKTASATD
jgi:UDP-GlcNAc:undecaprenyl-phosphate/decaprenyl-phosphate GlcNAc-1-phosphate transferase